MKEKQLQNFKDRNVQKEKFYKNESSVNDNSANITAPRHFIFLFFIMCLLS